MYARRLSIIFLLTTAAAWADQPPVLVSNGLTQTNQPGTQVVAQSAVAPGTNSASSEPSKDGTPAVVTLHDAVVQSDQPVKAVMPLPPVQKDIKNEEFSSTQKKRAPDLTLLRIWVIDGKRTATIQVRGVTRSGLQVGDHVLKSVISEIHDDGVCLDPTTGAGVRKTKCAKFVSFNEE